MKEHVAHKADISKARKMLVGKCAGKRTFVKLRRRRKILK
jgi:hypothetical protein